MLDPPAEPTPLPPRPAPPRSIAERALAWVQWFGAGRLLAAGCSVALVVAGGAWLLRSPVPAVETELPVAAASGTPSGVTATLPPPTSPPGVAGPASTAPGLVVVHVAGRVVAPGVYRLTAPARVADGIAAAGGVTIDGDPNALNMAAPLSDGQRVYVPAIGEIDPASVASAGDPAAPVAVGSSESASSAPAPLDLNLATAAELETLPGVGPALATAIVDDRTRNGPFATVDDLDRVSGIGPAKLAALREWVTV